MFTLHQLTTVTDIYVENGKVVGCLETDKGCINMGMVLNATAGWCTTIADMARVKLPITIFPLQDCVSKPLKPFLDVIIFQVVCTFTSANRDAVSW